MFLPVTFIVLLIVAACLLLGIWLLRQAARDRRPTPAGDGRHAMDALRCSKCGQVEPVVAQFCGHCGARLT